MNRRFIVIVALQVLVTAVLVASIPLSQRGKPHPDRRTQSAEYNHSQTEHALAAIDTQHSAVKADGSPNGQTTEEDDNVSQTVAAWVQAFAAVVSLALTIWLIYYSHRGWEAAERSASAAATQADLMRQQLVGTMGAWFNCQIRLADVGVFVKLTNMGQVDARDIEGTIHIAPVTLPDLNPIAAGKQHQFRYAVAGHKRPLEVAYGFPPEWMPPRDWNLWPNANTVFVDVEFSWDNGFGDRRTEQQGGVYLPIWEYKVRGGSGSRGGGPYFVDRSSAVDMWKDISEQVRTGRHAQDPK